jgi:2'-5' RNA ligase
MRAFIAVDLPDWVKVDLESIQDSVLDARWVSGENMHLTLKFLGDLDVFQIEDLGYELARIDMPSFELSLSGAGQFSNGVGVKMLWMGLAPHAPIIALQQQVERACRRARCLGDRQTFKPHITLARFSYPPDIERARSYLERHSQMDRDSFRVSGFSLLSSELHPTGPIYRNEADFPFTDAGISDTPFFDDWEEERL